MLCIATQYTPSVQRTAVFIIDIMMSLYKVAALAALLALLLSASFSSALVSERRAHTQQFAVHGSFIQPH